MNKYKTISIVIIFLFSLLFGCTNRKEKHFDWQEKYLVQEKSRIVTIKKSYDFRKGAYILKYGDTSFVTFNDKGQKISENNRNFYQYDSSGKLIEEEACIRTCENPYSNKYFYDNSNLLIKTTTTFGGNGKERIDGLFFYKDTLLIKKIDGDDSLSSSEVYSYDELSRIKSKVERRYNLNVNQWFEYVDSMYYDTNDKLIIKKSRVIGEEMLKITRYIYDKNVLISEIDTAITSLKINLPSINTVHSPLFNKREYKYNSEGKLIEEIVYQPDYKTPSYKITYDYQ